MLALKQDLGAGCKGQDSVIARQGSRYAVSDGAQLSTKSEWKHGPSRD